jgi:CheY-like chemotaxis protein
MADEQTREPALAGARILVVEDEAVVAFDLELSLRDFGCEVLAPVASVADALASLEGGRPDAVVLDINLSDGPAGPLARRLSEAGVPYIVTSGYDADQIADPLLRDVPRLGKPYQPEELRQALLELLGGRARER